MVRLMDAGCTNWGTVLTILGTAAVLVTALVGPPGVGVEVVVTVAGAATTWITACEAGVGVGWRTGVVAVMVAVVVVVVGWDCSATVLSG